jgi:hypothetical protein
MEGQARLGTEVEAVLRLDQRNIDTILESGMSKIPDHPSFHYFIVEFVEGKCLHDLLRNGCRYMPKQSAEIAMDIYLAPSA